MSTTEQSVRDFILAEFLPGEDPAQLTGATPLKLAAFLEEQFRIELAAHELSADYLNTVTDIVKLVESKRASA